VTGNDGARLYSGRLHYLRDGVSDIRWFPSSFCESFETLTALARSNEGWRVCAVDRSVVLNGRARFMGVRCVSIGWGYAAMVVMAAAELGARSQRMEGFCHFERERFSRMPLPR
jgi:hypothetical protein